jgi:hypothetical protein
LNVFYLLLHTFIVSTFCNKVKEHVTSFQYFSLYFLNTLILLKNKKNNESEKKPERSK